MKDQDTAPLLVKESEAARLLGLQPATLRNWRTQGKGPAWISNPDTSRFIGYEPDALDAWIRKGRGA